MYAHKLFFQKSKTRSHIILLKKLCNVAEGPETSLEIYQNIHFTSCIQKTANAMATNMEKHILCYCRWVV